MIGRGIVAGISGATIWRWLSADAIRPWVNNGTTPSVVENFDANFDFRVQEAKLLGGKFPSGEFKIVGGFSDGDGALSIDRSANVTVDTVKMADLSASGDNGVDLKGCSGPVTIKNSHLEGILTAVRIRTCQSVRLEGNLINGHNGHGIDTAESKGVTITGNTIENNAQDGVNVGAKSENVTITNNTIRSNGGCGVRVAKDAKNVVESGNTFAANAKGNVCR